MNRKQQQQQTRQNPLYPRPMTSYETGYKMVLCTLEIGYCFYRSFSLLRQRLRENHTVWSERGYKECRTSLTEFSRG